MPSRKTPSSAPYATEAICSPTSTTRPTLCRAINASANSYVYLFMRVGGSGEEDLRVVARDGVEAVEKARIARLAILAALTFAEELERLRRDHQALISHLEALNQRLSAAIDGSEYRAGDERAR